jgi:hypothetical protein
MHADLDVSIQTTPAIARLWARSWHRQSACRIDITGDHAFVVVPLTYSYKQGRKDMHETATGTFTLQKSASRWRLTGAVYSPR